jgi:hypothetical protein
VKIVATITGPGLVSGICTVYIEEAAQVGVWVAPAFRYAEATRAVAPSRPGTLERGSDPARSERTARRRPGPDQGSLSNESFDGREPVEPRPARGELPAVAERPRLGRRHLAHLLRGLRAGPVGGRARRGRWRARRRAHSGRRHPVDRRLPRDRPLPGRPRPLEAQRQARVARDARPRRVRAVGGRPRPRVLQPVLRPPLLHPAPAHRHPPRDLLPEDRRRVHAHPQQRGPHVAAGPDGAEPQPPAVRPAPEAPDHPEAKCGRAVRDVPAHPLRRPEAVLARRGRDADPAARRDHRALGQARRQGDRARDAAPRPAERAGQHPEQAVRPDLQRV